MKILIIGQAPPAKPQGVPYDSTMLYDWLKECGVSKEDAQNMFEFDAVYNKFPGHGETGHKVPTFGQMETYWPTLWEKIQKVDRVWILGNVAAAFLYSKPEFERVIHQLHTIHPSKLNWNLYQKNKDKIINQIKNFIL